MGKGTEIRVTRALRDGAAYRIAEALVDQGRPYRGDIEDFKKYREQHRRLLLKMVYKRKADKPDGKQKAL